MTFVYECDLAMCDLRVMIVFVRVFNSDDCDVDVDVDD